MDHEVCLEAQVETPLVVEAQITRSVLAALEAEDVGVPCMVGVCVTNDEGIHQTNLETRGVDRPTDVLSFPMFELSPGEKPRAAWAEPDTHKVYLGDMMISLERARAQAEEFGHSPEREVCYLAVHSVLHLLGYDHLDEGPMKAQMRAREEAILGKLGITRGAPDEV
ncbi:rRNA maturation RNase YbeY [Pseudoflavonifractor sp. 60]|uniref:rRNA maturation RNase YbeY n=1 Tax=Pseudoflavonifractor sp. 60 TaxID=2304576 RepID=UPI00136A283D|nr:rRNA maturation RNase YbeY [Pseudoflavonifractor sp. 60]NBI67421.1 rRNA maturation RNase YbeY [Pseudoflavonifractor sp. 60]